ncbi:predicted protein [Histoplasma capsulatum H143]|uniref:Uncharacterized protein n=1 Tax=Ajellomyces capsulatus (strain H143) TaxID=544712 RepID=C6HNE2_AJECH|nr:predicted protein [Histoplasma capsulatum H143]
MSLYDLPEISPLDEDSVFLPGVSSTIPGALSLDSEALSSECKTNSGLPSRGFVIAATVDAEVNASTRFNVPAVQYAQPTPHQELGQSCTVNPKFLTLPKDATSTQYDLLIDSNLPHLHADQNGDLFAGVSQNGKVSSFAPQTPASSLKSVGNAFVDQQCNSNSAANPRVSFVTPLNERPRQFYTPTMNSDIQKSANNLNFDEWYRDGGDYASPCPAPRGETSRDQSVVDLRFLGSLSHYIISNPVSSQIQSTVRRLDFHKDSPPELSQSEFDELVDSNEFLPDLLLSPSPCHPAEQKIFKKHEASDFCLESPTLKPPRREKKMFVREYNLRKLPTRKVKRPQGPSRSDPSSPAMQEKKPKRFAGVHKAR